MYCLVKMLDTQSTKKHIIRCYQNVALAQTTAPILLEYVSVICR